MSTPLLTDVAGMTGVVLYLLSYGLLQSGRLSQDGRTYPTLNLLAASMVLISLSADFNLASALIQVSWILISLAGLNRLAGANRQLTENCTVISACDRTNSGPSRASDWSPECGPSVS